MADRNNIGTIRNYNELKEGGFWICAEENASAAAPGIYQIHPENRTRFNDGELINFYWCPQLPFTATTPEVGFVDFPITPEGNNPCFVFTPPLSGCSLILRRSIVDPLKRLDSRTHLRLFHHTHPESSSNNQIIMNYIKAHSTRFHEINELDANNYWTPFFANNELITVFAFLFYRNSMWNFCWQPSRLNPKEGFYEPITNRMVYTKPINLGNTN